MKPKSSSIIIAESVSEADFLALVIEIAHLFKWRVHHQRPAWTSKGYRSAIQGDAGFPDLVLVRGKHLIFAELKSAKGKLEPSQKGWEEVIGELTIWASRMEDSEAYFPVRHYVWRPQDIEAIKKVLL